MMIFLKKFQETYNSRLRERYGADPSTHLNFDLDLLIEVGSSGEPDKNQVYGLSNPTAENLRTARSVSTVGSSLSVSSTQSEEFMALKQHYERLSTDYDQLRQMVMEMRSRMEWGGGLAGIQTAIHLGRYMDGIYWAHDVWAVHTVLIVRRQQSEPVNSWFGDHAHRWLRLIQRTCKADGKINFNEIYC